MLLTPIVAVAILARSWRWSELATLIAAFSALAAKDPLVVLLRQHFVWKRPHPDAPAALRWFAGWSLLFCVSGLVLLAAWPFRAIVGMGAGLLAFSALAIGVNVKNLQRSTLFQIASALALTSSSLAACLSATGHIQTWCWWFWMLMAMQATAGILVVHARLDARIALRRAVPASPQFRRAAFVALAVLAAAGIASLVLRRFAIALALCLAALGYAWDLRSQRDSKSLQMPLQRVGQRALALSSAYAALLIVGLW
jgi:YwiC-like protein